MFHGSMVALVTPMAEDGSLDFVALERLVEFHIENKTDAIVAMGTTGESATLDPDEHCDVIHKTVGFVKGRVPVIAGAGANSTSEAIHLARCAIDAGADACLQVTPYYNKPPQEGLYRHFKAIAEAVPAPQILYNVPGRTACDMLPETVSRLADIPNIVGIKEANTLERIETLIKLCGDRIDIYTGDDPVTLGTVLAGGKGVISVTANVAPRLVHDLCVAAAAGDIEKAKLIDERLQVLNEALFIEANPIPVKWALAQMGLMPAGIRLPLVPLAEEFHEPVRRALRETGLL